MAIGSRRKTPVCPVAAAVASRSPQSPRGTSRGASRRPPPRAARRSAGGPQRGWRRWAPPWGPPDSGAITGHCRAATVKRALGWAAGRPADGVQGRRSQSVSSSGALGVMFLPPHIALVGQRAIREDRVVAQGAHGVGVGAQSRARRHPEEPGLRVDGVEPAVRCRLHPGDVVTDGLDGPARQGGLEHGEVGLAAGRWERPRHVAVFSLGAGELQDEHVLGQPALVAGLHRGDAQGVALLAEQRVAPVARAERPDLAGLWEVADVLVLRIARPGHIGIRGS